jgi:RNA methyltransferase, TrmH family
MPLSKNDLKKFSSLDRKSKRKEHGLFIVEGRKNCEELIKSDVVIEELFITNDVVEIFPNGNIISEKEASRLSQLKTHSSVIAIARIPKQEIDSNNNQLIMYLDNIKDPGNLGTIIRTLDWFGHTQLFCSENTVDSFNPKVIMASMGSIFRLNVHYLAFEKLCEIYPDHLSYATCLNGENINEVEIPRSAIIVMGNESNGINENIIAKCSRKISISGNGKAESLNVSTACGILINEYQRN